MRVPLSSHLDDVGPDDLLASPSWDSIRPDFALPTSAEEVVADFVFAVLRVHLEALQVTTKQGLDPIQVVFFHFPKTWQRCICWKSSQLDHTGKGRVARDVGKVDIDKLGNVESAVVVSGRLRIQCP